jgi:hypothetical protein
MSLNSLVIYARRADGVTIPDETRIDLNITVTTPE